MRPSPSSRYSVLASNGNARSATRMKPASPFAIPLQHDNRIGCCFHSRKQGTSHRNGFRSEPPVARPYRARSRRLRRLRAGAAGSVDLMGRRTRRRSLRRGPGDRTARGRRLVPQQLPPLGSSVPPLCLPPPSRGPPEQSASRHKLRWLGDHGGKTRRSAAVLCFGS